MRECTFWIAGQGGLGTFVFDPLDICSGMCANVVVWLAAEDIIYVERLYVDGSKWEVTMHTEGGAASGPSITDK
jgi:hypothetical protein